MPLQKITAVSCAALLLALIVAFTSPSARAATISFVGVEPGTSGSGFATQNWSNAGVAKEYDLSGNVYGTAGYYQIRPIAYPSSTTIYTSASAGNDLGTSAGSNPTLYSAPVFLSSITGGAGDYVNFTNYAIFRGPDGSALYTQGGLSVPVNQGPFNTPSGGNSGYFGSAFSFTMGSNMGASFRIGVAVDTVADGTYAPDYVSFFNSGTGSVYSTQLTRNGTPDMAVFDVTAAAGDSFSAALWQLTNTQSAAAFSLITFDVSSYNLDVASGAQTNSSVLGGAAAGLLKTGAGTAVLSASNTYSGGTTLSAGTLRMDNANAAGTGTITQSSGASTLQINTTGTVSNAMSVYNVATLSNVILSGAQTLNGATYDVASSTTNTVSGTVSGSGGLTKAGSGRIILGASNNYTGTTTISAGNLQVSDGNALGGTADGTTVQGTGVLRLTATNSSGLTLVGENVNLSVGSTNTANFISDRGSGVLGNVTNVYQGKITVGGSEARIDSLGSGGVHTLILTNAGNVIESTNNATVAFGGAGPVLLRGAINVGSGEVQKIGGGTLTVQSGGTLGGATAGLLLTNGNIDLGSGSLTNAYFTIRSGVITNGTLTATTYNLNGGSVRVGLGAGTVNAASGTTSVTNGGSLGAGTVNVTGGALNLGSGGLLATNAAVTVDSGQITLGGNETIGSLAGTGGTVALGANSLTTGGANTSTTFSGVLTGSGVLTKVGSATQTLSGANTYTGGTLISAGTLELGSGGSIAGNISGGGSLTKSTAAAASLWNPNTYTGATVVEGGQLRLDGSGSISSASVVQVASGASFSATGIFKTSNNLTIAGLTGDGQFYNAAGTVTVNQASGNSTFAGTIDGGTGLTKSGAGTWTLSGASTYTGATTVSGGGLIVNGTNASATTVQNGATLGGSGTLASATIQSGGTIAPGNSPGTLTLTSGLTWAGGGNYNWQIFNVAGTAGQTNTWDLISLTGGNWDITGLSSTNKFNINLWSLSGLPDTTGLATGFDATQNYSWKILDAAGITGSFNTNLFTINTGAINGTGGFTGATGLFSLAMDSNNDLFLSYTGAGAAVPEPGTWAAGGLLLVLAAVARRRAKLRAEKAA
jgi:autotransporter-associated beta strand protein